MVSRPACKRSRTSPTVAAAIEIHFGGGGSHREFHNSAVHPLAVHASKIFEEHPIGEGRVQINLALDASTDRTERFVARQCDWQSQPIVIDQAFTRSEVTNTTQKETNGRCPPFWPPKMCKPLAVQRLLRQTVDRSLRRPPRGTRIGIRRIVTLPHARARRLR